MALWKEVLAIITGAGSGLGRATAQSLASKGARVVIADLPGSAGYITAKEIPENRAIFAPVDVTDEKSISEALELAHKTFGRNINVAVNCAGIAIAKKTLGRENKVHDIDSFTKVLQVNTIGTFNVIRLSAAKMASNNPSDSGERGVIINTASIAAYDGQIGQAAYAASKGAIVGMTLPIARDLAPLGIRIVTIAPGIFLTPMVAGLPAAVQKELGQQVPFPPRLGQPEDFARLVRSIIKNPYLNGSVIRLDGSLRMPPK